jgi:hypothetical protein
MHYIYLIQYQLFYVCRTISRAWEHWLNSYYIFVFCRYHLFYICGIISRAWEHWLNLYYIFVFVGTSYSISAGQLAGVVVGVFVLYNKFHFVCFGEESKLMNIHYNVLQFVLTVWYIFTTYLPCEVHSLNSCKNLTRWLWPMTLKINRVPDSPKD